MLEWLCQSWLALVNFNVAMLHDSFVAILLQTKSLCTG